MQIDKEIDTRGLNCPLPILKAKKALTEMTSGQLLKVVSTDGGSLRDFQAFAKQTGNELVEQQTLDGEFVIWELEINGEQIMRLAVDFTQRSEGKGPPLRGKLRINSTLQ